jgi:hypothetical protein
LYQRRPNSEEERDDHADTQREQQHCRIQTDGLNARQDAGGDALHECESQTGHQQSDERARQTQHEALGKHFASQATTAGTQRRPHCNFSSPGFAPHQQQVRHVGACDQQHETHRAQNEPQCGAHVRNQIVRETNRAELLSEIRIGVIRG